MGGLQERPAKAAVAFSHDMMAKVGTLFRKNVSIWSLAKMINASGLVSSSSLPNWRMAAMPASSCLGSSSGGRVKSCGACMVAIAATICPITPPDREVGRAIEKPRKWRCGDSILARNERIHSSELREMAHGQARMRSAAAGGFHHALGFSALQRPHGEEVGIGHQEREGDRQQRRRQPDLKLIRRGARIELSSDDARHFAI